MQKEVESFHGVFIDITLNFESSLPDSQHDRGPVGLSGDKGGPPEIGIRVRRPRPTVIKVFVHRDEYRQIYGTQMLKSSLCIFYCTNLSSSLKRLVLMTTCNKSVV